MKMNKHCARTHKLSVCFLCCFLHLTHGTGGDSGHAAIVIRICGRPVALEDVLDLVHDYADPIIGGAMIHVHTAGLLAATVMVLICVESSRALQEQLGRRFSPAARAADSEAMEAILCSHSD